MNIYLVRRILLPLALLAGLLTADARAQGVPPVPAPIVGPPALSAYSWYYQQLEPPRQIQKHDIITVVVSFDSQFLSEGEVERRKRAQMDALLSDWLRLDGLSLKPAVQADGDPRVRGTLNNQFTADSDIATRDRLQFTIAATVRDVRPNGYLVIEAHQIFNNNEETWEQMLSGIVRPEDVSPNNQVLSRHIAELSVQKRECGAVRDGYRRTWFTRFLDQVWPF